MQNSSHTHNSADTKNDGVVAVRVITEDEMKLISGSGPLTPERSCW